MILATLRDNFGELFHPIGTGGVSGALRQF
jgi:hypothetical protein